LPEDCTSNRGDPPGTGDLGILREVSMKHVVIVEESEIVTLALCEQNMIVLKPNTLYLFEEHAGCDECRRIADAYREVK
jgi:hypothetical protein